MKVLVKVSTNRVGSTVTTTIEIDDEDVEGMSESELSQYVESIAKDTMLDLVQWNWEIVE